MGNGMLDMVNEDEPDATRYGEHFHIIKENHRSLGAKEPADQFR